MPFVIVSKKNDDQNDKEIAKKI